ncbi:43359_t:CDS:1, partial [Gigaspora margarita]
FYELNDIEINPTKTELVVVKPGAKRVVNELFVWAGNPKTKILAKGWKEATRFLGVWILARNQQRSDMCKAKAE